MKWFRLYHDIVDDPKVGLMSESEQLLWIKLLCLASMSSERGVILMSDDELAFRLRIDESKWLSAKDTFTHCELIDVSSHGSVKITGWHESQNSDNNRPSLAEWRVLRAEIFARDNYTCQYCGDRGVALQCDHIIPVSRGGSNDRSNLTTACRTCNQSKHNKTPNEWLGGAS